MTPRQRYLASPKGKAARQRAKVSSSYKKARQRYRTTLKWRACLYRSGLKYRFGMTPEQWQDMFLRQGERCAACSVLEPGRKTGWHTHHTGSKKTGDLKVHGILCHHCNIAARAATPEVVSQLRALAIYVENCNAAVS